MKLRKNQTGPRRFTTAQIAGIACGSAVVIGAVGFFSYQTLSPTSYIRQMTHSGISSGADLILTDTQVRKLSDQVIQNSMEVLSSDVLADFINRAVDATLDKTTIENAINDVLAQGDVALTDAQKKAIAAQVRQNVEASWLAVTGDTEGFTEDQISYLTNMIAQEITNELSNYTVTSTGDVAASQSSSQEAIIKEVINRLFPDHPEYADGYATPSHVLTEDDIADLLKKLDATSLQELRNQIRSQNGTTQESTADAIAGNTIYGKLGTLQNEIKKNTKSASKANTAVAEEVVARAALKELMDANIQNVNASIIKLQANINNSNTTNDAALAAAKKELQQSISSLTTTMSTNITGVSNETKSSIADINKQLLTLQDAIASSRNTEKDITDSLTAAKSELSASLTNLDHSLREEIASLDGKFESSTPSELEKTAESIDGTTFFGKLGTLWNELVLQKNHISLMGNTLSSAISDEMKERESATQTLQNTINSQVDNVNTAMTNLQNALNDANGANADAISAAKTELSDALSALDSTLSGDISQLDADTRDKLTNLNNLISKLKTSLEGSDDELRVALGSAKTDLSNQISDLDTSLSNALEKEKENREKAEAELQAQIKSEANTELEKVATNDLPGATVFAKLGTLYKSIGAVKKSETWAQNITLSNSSSSGTKIFAIQDSTDPNHAGWKMWRIDGESLGLDFRAKTSDSPDSEVKVNFAGKPAFIKEWGAVEDGYITLYTPTVPDADIYISSIHVTNKISD